MMTKRAGVIGWPVKHSKSPLIHNYWMKQCGLDGVYSAVEVAPEELKTFVQKLKDEGFSGFNVTVPHKVAIMDLLDEVSETAEKAGAVNTVAVLADGRLAGDNTDGFGFIENIKACCPGFDFTGKTAAVLGTGGAARGICAALQRAGCAEIRLTYRTKSKAHDLAQKIGGNFRLYEWQDKERALEDADMLANATTLGMNGFDPLEIDLTRLDVSAVVADAVYVPLETQLLKQAREKGCRTADGLGMLLYQAKAAFKIWFGVDPVVTDELRELVLK